MSNIYYILFKEKIYIHSCQKLLKEYDLEFEIVPSPRALSSNCNHSIKINENDYEMTAKLLKIHTEIKTAGIHKWKEQNWMKNLFKK